MTSIQSSPSCLSEDTSHIDWTQRFINDYTMKPLCWIAVKYDCGLKKNDWSDAQIKEHRACQVQYLLFYNFVIPHDLKNTPALFFLY